MAAGELGLDLAPMEESAKVRVEECVRRHRDELVDLSHRLHDHPELGFEETRAVSWVAEPLERSAFAVVKGICNLPTAFIATSGSGALTVAICAEYDALPGMGHACGHNVIAAAAVGAGIALAEVAGDLGITVKVLGTPAEEGGGGKIIMLEGGAFDGIHAALMVHPGPVEQVQLECLAASHFAVRYTGKAAHASGHPEEGINAADAVTVAQVAIGLIRQHLPEGSRVHGIVRRGGEAANVVPAFAEVEYFVRAPTIAQLAEVEPQVMRCFEAGAIATGAAWEVVPLGPVYSEFRPDPDMQGAWRRNAETLGRTFPDAPTTPMSTDMANVSLAIPAIHPMLGIGSLPAVNHQPEFATAAVSAEADKAIVDGAIAMAWTAIDLATNPKVRERLLAGQRGG